jgi:hypothetical protein
MPHISRVRSGQCAQPKWRQQLTFHSSYHPRRPFHIKHGMAQTYGKDLVGGFPVIEHVAGVHWNSLFTRRGIRQSEKGYTCQSTTVVSVSGRIALRSLLGHPVTFGFSANPIPRRKPAQMRFLLSVPQNSGVLPRNAELERERCLSLRAQLNKRGHGRTRWMP